MQKKNHLSSAWKEEKKARPEDNIISLRSIPDHAAAEAQSPAHSCSSSWPGTGKMIETGRQTHPPCPTTTGSATAYS